MKLGTKLTWLFAVVMIVCCSMATSGCDDDEETKSDGDSKTSKEKVDDADEKYK